MLFQGENRRLLAAPALTLAALLLLTLCPVICAGAACQPVKASHCHPSPSVKCDCAQAPLAAKNPDVAPHNAALVNVFHALEIHPGRIEFRSVPLPPSMTTDRLPTVSLRI